MFSLSNSNLSLSMADLLVQSLVAGKKNIVCLDHLVALEFDLMPELLFGAQPMGPLLVASKMASRYVADKIVLSPRVEDSQCCNHIQILDRAVLDPADCKIDGTSVAVGRSVRHVSENGQCNIYIDWTVVDVPADRDGKMSVLVVCCVVLRSRTFHWQRLLSVNSTVLHPVTDSELCPDRELQQIVGKLELVVPLGSLGALVNRRTGCSSSILENRP